MSIFKLFKTNKIRGADYEAMIETECSECFIRVTGFKDVGVDNKYEDNYVYLSNFTAHNGNSMATWKWRRTRIWRIIRGFPDPDYEILSVKVMDAVIKAMQECREEVWGKNNVDVKGGEAAS